LHTGADAGADADAGAEADAATDADAAAVAFADALEHPITDSTPIAAHRIAPYFVPTVSRRAASPPGAMSCGPRA